MLYFDYHASTPVDEQVLKTMLPWFQENYANPSSSHAAGKKAKQAVEKAREQIAELIRAQPNQIVFTSGATESNNQAIGGICEPHWDVGGHILTTPVEHHAVLNPCEYLAENGFDVEYLPVDKFGRVDPQDVKKHLRANTLLVTIIHANNEVGTLNPIQEIGQICQERKVPFHTDAAQSVGHEEIDVAAMGIDLLSLSGHKFYAPKGVGALFINQPNIQLTPLLRGGGQESGLRSGTLNVASIVGMGEAARLVKESRNEENKRLIELREILLRRLVGTFADLQLNGHPTERLPNHLSVSIPGLSAQMLMEALPEVALSGGSACTKAGGSHVAKALGLAELAGSTLRIGLGRASEERQVQRLADLLIATICKLRP